MPKQSLAKQPWPYLVLITAMAIYGVWSTSGNRTVGYFLLGFSIILIILGIGASFSKKEFERTREQVLADLPERAALINAPDAAKTFRRRGYITLAVGIVLFLLWTQLYGLSSLAAGI